MIQKVESQVRVHHRDLLGRQRRRRRARVSAFRPCRQALQAGAQTSLGPAHRGAVGVQRQGEEGEVAAGRGQRLRVERGGGHAQRLAIGASHLLSLQSGSKAKRRGGGRL